MSQQRPPKSTLIKQSLVFVLVAMGLALLNDSLFPGSLLKDREAKVAELEALQPIYTLDPLALKQPPRPGEYVILDTRPFSDYQNNHPHDALAVPLRGAEFHIKQHLPKLLGQNILFVGDHDQHKAVRNLAQRLGPEIDAQKLFIFKGGWQAWRDAGWPTREGAATP